LLAAEARTLSSESGLHVKKPERWSAEPRDRSRALVETEFNSEASTAKTTFILDFFV